MSTTMLFVRIKDKINSDPNFYALLFLLAAGFTLYAYTFGCDWSYDDIFVIHDNTDVRSLEGFIQNNYPGRPLRELSALLDYKLFGDIKTGWHIQNVFWHSLNAWLVFVISRRLLNDKYIAWVASLLFLVHPLQVEVVAQISHRKDSLALFCMLASFIFYFQGRIDKKVMYIILSLVSFLLAIFAKQNAYIFPVFVLLFELLCGHRIFDGKILNRKLVFCCLLGVIALMPLLVDWSGFVSRANTLLVGNNYFEDFSPLVYLMAIVNAWGHMFLKLVLPVNLSVNYVLVPPDSLLSFNIILIFSLMILYLSFLIHSSKKNVYLLFALLWLFILYIPTSNLFPITHIAADRYMYAPSVGFCMAASFLIKKIIAPKQILIVTVTIVAVLSMLTILQSMVWQNNVTLWTHSLMVNPNSARAVSNIGQLLHKDDLERNLEMQMHAASINPYDPFVQKEIGEIYEERGEIDIATEYYRRAYDLYPAAQKMYKDFYEGLRKKLTDNSPDG